MRPNVVIKHGRLLEPFFRAFVEEKYPGFAFPTNSEVEAKVAAFRGAWRLRSEVFFKGIESLGLSFIRNRIDVFVVSATDRDMSAPLIVRSRYDEAEFIGVLFHELLHNLFNDIGLLKAYPEESERTRSHVYVFAALEYLFRDVMGEPERLETERGKSGPGTNPDYHKAWMIVERDGYLRILQSLRHARSEAPSVPLE